MSHFVSKRVLLAMIRAEREEAEAGIKSGSVLQEGKWVAIEKFRRWALEMDLDIAKTTSSSDLGDDDEELARELLISGLGDTQISRICTADISKGLIGTAAEEEGDENGEKIAFSIFESRGEKMKTDGVSDCVEKLTAFAKALRDGAKK